MDIHRSALRHGLTEDDIRHAIDNSVAVADLDPDADPPKVLVIGPDLAGNLLEVVLLDLADDVLAIHAMALRATFYDLLPERRDLR